MAAAVRTLLRRRAAAPPSLALLQPLFPVSLKPTYVIQPRSPLLGVAAVLPDVRRPQVSPAPAQPLLRYHSSSKPSKRCESPPQRQPPNSSKETPRLELERLELGEDAEFLIGGLQENLEKHTRNINEALSICIKKANALFNEGWDNKTVAMFENELEKVFEALADREKAVDDISGALDCSNASTDTLQKFQMFHKKSLDDNKFIRQELNDVQTLFMAMKIIRNKVKRVDLPISLFGQKNPNKLSKFKGNAVAFGTCFALTLMINMTFLYSIHI